MDNASFFPLFKKAYQEVANRRDQPLSRIDEACATLHERFMRPEFGLTNWDSKALVSAFRCLANVLVPMLPNFANYQALLGEHGWVRPANSAILDAIQTTRAFLLVREGHFRDEIAGQGDQAFLQRMDLAKERYQPVADHFPKGTGDVKFEAYIHPECPGLTIQLAEGRAKSPYFESFDAAFFAEEKFAKAARHAFQSQFIRDLFTRPGARQTGSYSCRSDGQEIHASLEEAGRDVADPALEAQILDYVPELIKSRKASFFPVFVETRKKMRFV